MIVRVVKRYERARRPGRYIEVGTQLDVTPEYGAQLIEQGVAVEHITKRVKAKSEEASHPPAVGEKRKFTTEKPKAKNAKKSSKTEDKG